MSGGVVNSQRTAEMLLNEFRLATIGRITLEKPKKSEKSNA
jgi:ribosome biogenesis GTPase A